jgi:hypothetical protein
VSEIRIAPDGEVVFMDLLGDLRVVAERLGTATAVTAGRPKPEGRRP